MAQTRAAGQRTLVKQLTRHAADRLMPDDLKVPWDEEQFGDDRIALFLRSVALGLDIDTSLAVSGWPNGQYWNWIAPHDRRVLILIPRSRTRPSARSSRWPTALLKRPPCS